MIISKQNRRTIYENLFKGPYALPYPDGALSNLIIRGRDGRQKGL
jgi:hypothetical protein